MKPCYSKTLSAFLFFGLSYSCFAVSLTIKPLTSVDIGIPKKEHRTVQYMVQNTSSNTQTFVLESIPGAVVLNEAPDNCQKETTLESGQSCVLNLQLSALNLSHQGPKFCSKDLKQCIEPKPDEKISVEYLPEGAPTIDLKIGTIKPDLQFSKIKARRCKSHFKKKTLNQINNKYDNYDDACNLEIFAGVDYYTGIGVVNTSTIPIYIYPPPILDPNIDTTFESSCTNYDINNPLQPGDWCAFYYKAPAGQSTPWNYTYFLVYPVSENNSNYIFVTYSTQVFTIGDYYPDEYTGQQIFQIPTEDPDTGVYVMYTVSNSLNPQLSQEDASYYCDYFEELPNITLLTTLQNLSTCNAGPIVDFDCNATYWSSDIDPSIARDFATSSNINPADPDSEYPSRCIKPYYF